MDNIFAMIVLACQHALQEGNLLEEELALHRLTIVRSLLKNGSYEKDRILRFLYFLKKFIFIRDDLLNQEFDESVADVSGGTIKMGVIEVIKKHATEDGVEIGIEKGRAEERKKSTDAIHEIARTLKKMGMGIPFIAQATKLSEEAIDAL